MTTLTKTQPSTPAAGKPAPVVGYTDPAGGFPVEVDPARDLGQQPAGSEFMYADSIYVTGQVTAPGRDFAFLVHVMRIPNQGVNRQTLSVTDKASGWYESHTAMVPAEDFSWAAGALNLRTPDLTWTGDAHHQHIAVATPWGALDVELAAAGPVLYYGGSGSWDMLGSRQHQYALPRLAVSGTLTVQGSTHRVSGA